MNCLVFQAFIIPMNKLVELRKLSAKFYEDYPESDYPEMERKIGRPYVILLVTIKDLKFGIPLRTNIKHSYCYKFKNSGRNTNSVTGIDFSKAVVIIKDSYLGDETDIDDKEYLELQEKTYFIIQKFKKYVDDYILYKTTGGNEYIARRYQFSTLKYFDNELLK